MNCPNAEHHSELLDGVACENGCGYVGTKIDETNCPNKDNHASVPVGESCPGGCGYTGVLNPVNCPNAANHENLLKGETCDCGYEGQKEPVTPPAHDCATEGHLYYYGVCIYCHNQLSQDDCAATGHHYSYGQCMKCGAKLPSENCDHPLYVGGYCIGCGQPKPAEPPLGGGGNSGTDSGELEQQAKSAETTTQTDKPTVETAEDSSLTEITDTPIINDDATDTDVIGVDGEGDVPSEDGAEVETEGEMAEEAGDSAVVDAEAPAEVPADSETVSESAEGEAAEVMDATDNDIDSTLESDDLDEEAAVEADVAEADAADQEIVTGDGEMVEEITSTIVEVEFTESMSEDVAMAA